MKWKEGEWAATYDEEFWPHQTHDTKEQAVLWIIREYDSEPDQTVWVGQVGPPPFPSMYDAEDMQDRIDERLYDLLGIDLDSSTIDLSAKHEEELNSLMDETLHKWLIDHSYWPPWWFWVKRCDGIIVTKAMVEEAFGEGVKK